VIAGAAVLALRFTHTSGGNAPPPNPSNSTSSVSSIEPVSAPEPEIKSASCKSCHEESYRYWEHSHHALAERPVDPGLDRIAFDPARTIKHVSQISQALISTGSFQIVTLGGDGKVQPFVPQRVIGVNPLRQYMIPELGGRFQVTELAFDPRSQDWFDMYGTDDRKPGEWGHWTGRGMTWNVMCAACHNTNVRKNYDFAGDTYRTTFTEMGVGCEACHGSMAAHNAFQAEHPNSNKDSTIKPVNREQMFAVCGSCHSRRGELTGNFRPGNSFYDHYSLSIPDETELYYPDGQIREEDYEFAAFSGSRMCASGVRCVDCHDPHSGKTKVEGNNLCLLCHGGPVPPAPKIDPATHSHHKLNERGDHCVECHMPVTTYMQRHERHDHGMTTPDPWLTKQFNIPNACDRCHADKGEDWNIAALEKWYGSHPPRPASVRAAILARTHRREDSVVPELIRLTQTETNSYWRAVAAGMLKEWSHQPDATAALIAAAGDPQPLVRATSVRALEFAPGGGDQRVETVLRRSLNDTSRWVRVEAAWALHAGRDFDTNSPAGRDLLADLRHNEDEPAGLLQAGVFKLDREDLAGAMRYFQRAILLDSNSAPLHVALATGLSQQGDSAAAVKALETAARLSPRDAEIRFKLGLALNETGNAPAARSALEEATRLDPNYARAWYNLGLAYNEAGEPERALESLVRAESIDSTSPEIPYARATILARLGRTDAARVAARRALELQPGNPAATALLQSLSR
jgi:tetratricopeptide (TPR) repeat protein